MLRIGLWVVVIFLSINLLLGILISLPAIQTRLAQWATKQLSETLNTKVQIKGIKIKFFSTIALQDLLIQDKQQDTLAFIPDLRLDIERIGLKTKKIRLGNLLLNGGYLNIYRNQSDTSFNHNFLLAYLDKPNLPANGTSEKNWQVFFSNFKFINGRFRYHDYKIPETPSRFNPAHLDFPLFAIQFEDIENTKNTLSMVIKNGVLRSSDAFSVDELSGKLAISPNGLGLSNLKINSRFSKLSGNILLQYNNWSDLSAFDSLVVIDAQINHAYLHPADIAFFGGGSPITAPLSIKGTINGMVNNLNANNLLIKAGKNLVFEGDIKLKGLPNLDKTLIQFETSKFEVTRNELEKLVANLSFPKALNPIQDLSFTGTFDGYLDNFKAKGNLNSNLGNINADLTVNLTKTLPSFKGSLALNNFDLGKLIDEPQIGALTLATQVEGEGNNISNLKVNLNGTLQYAWVNKYKYQGFTYNGFFSQKIMKGKIDSQDPNVRFSLAGFADFSQKKPDVDLEATINLLDLKALNLSTDSALFAGVIQLCYKGNNLDDADGNLHLRQFKYKKPNKTLLLNDVELSTHFDELGYRTIEAHANNLYAEMVGKFSLENLPKTIESFASQFASKRFDRQVNLNNEWFSFRFEANKQDELINFFLDDPLLLGLVRLQGRFDGRTNRMLYNGQIQHFGFNNNKLDNIRFIGKTSNDTLYLQTKLAGFYQSDSLIATNFVSNQIFSDNHLFVDLTTETPDAKNKLDLGFLADFNQQNTHFTLDKIILSLGKNEWKAIQNGPIVLEDTALFIQSLAFKHANQSLDIFGRISKAPTDTMHLNIENFDLEQLNNWLKNFNTRLEGELNAELEVAAVLKNPFFLGDLYLAEFALDGKPIGDLEIHSKYDPAAKLAQVDAVLLSNFDTLALINGNIDFEHKNNINFVASLNKTTVTPINKLLEPDFRDATGYVTAEINITGTLDDPVVTGKATLENGSVIVDYLNTTYYISNDVIFEPEAIIFNQMPITDGESGTGILSGKIIHKHFRNTHLDLRIDCRNMLALNTNRNNGELYFGRGKASGFATFKGHVSNFDIYIAATTRPGTRIQILVDDDLGLDKKEFIKFVNRNAKTDLTKSKEAFALEKIGFLMDLTVTPDAEGILLLDQVGGDNIKGYGSGQLKLEYNRNGDFEMFGTYTINQGDYLFTFENLINKKFEINPGGTLRWTGDPYLAQIDIQAIYRVRTNLTPLLQGANINPIEIERYQNARFPVELFLQMRGLLTKPEIGFELKVPTFNNNDLGNPIVQQLRNINANEPELNKQVFGLLMLNQFIANDLSGNTSVATGVNSVSELLSNQISSLLSQYAGNVNIGINYRENAGVVNNNNRRDVQVALNTSLFNNKLVIDGNLGMGNNPAVNNPQGIGADFNIEYKLTEDGKLRATAFNKLDDRILVNRDLNYRQGVGLSYRRSFENFEDIWLKPYLELNRMLNETLGFLWGRKKTGKNRFSLPFPLPPAQIENNNKPVIDSLQGDWKLLTPTK